MRIPAGQRSASRGGWGWHSQGADKKRVTKSKRRATAVRLALDAQGHAAPVKPDPISAVLDPGQVQAKYGAGTEGRPGVRGRSPPHSGIRSWLSDGRALAARSFCQP